MDAPTMEALAPNVPALNAEDVAVRIAAERPEDAAVVSDLVERAFGPGRYAKTAERLREGNRLARSPLGEPLSFCAFGDGELVGAVRQWPVLVGAARGLFLGPIAVEPGWRKHGLGGQLVERCCAAAADAGEPFILLVGDEPLFVQHGFQHVPAGRVALPGPVNPARVFWRALQKNGGQNDSGLEGVSGPVRVPPRAMGRLRTNED